MGLPMRQVDLFFLLPSSHVTATALVVTIIVVYSFDQEFFPFAILECRLDLL
jgi:hypothetical protein